MMFMQNILISTHTSHHTCRLRSEYLDQRATEQNERKLLYQAKTKKKHRFFWTKFLCLLHFPQNEMKQTVKF